MTPIQPDTPSTELPMLLFMATIAGLLALLSFVMVLWSYRRMKAAVIRRNAALSHHAEFTRPVDAWSEAGRRLDGVDPHPWLDEEED